MSDKALDGKFYVSFGVVLSVQYADVGKVRAAIEGAGAKIVFQTASTGPLCLLRRHEVERILAGDTSRLKEMHARKSRERSGFVVEKGSERPQQVP